MHVIFVTENEPGPLEGGGPRRTHQLFHELRTVFGEDHVKILDFGKIFFPAVHQKSTIYRYSSRVIGRVQNYLANPYQILSGDRYGFEHQPGIVLQKYSEAVQSTHEVKLCVLENPRLGPLVNVNARLGIETVVAPWSFESLTHSLPTLWSSLQEMRTQCHTGHHRILVRSALNDFANELILLSRALKGWFLSKIETGFALALGLTAAYMPYYPIGEARNALLRIRAKRTDKTVDSGPFVITSAGNTQNRVALEQFLLHLNIAGLPSGIRIVIVGETQKPEKLTPRLHPVIQFRGRIPLADFDDLLVHARAVLIPQNCGFGCMTRVPDMLCAGIPVIADPIVANPTGEIPGVDYVDDKTGGWIGALERALRGRMSFSLCDYDDWHDLMRSIVLNELKNTHLRLT